MYNVLKHSSITIYAKVGIIVTSSVYIMDMG